MYCRKLTPAGSGGYMMLIHGMNKINSKSRHLFEPAFSLRHAKVKVAVNFFAYFCLPILISTDQ